MDRISITSLWQTLESAMWKLVTTLRDIMLLPLFAWVSLKLVLVYRYISWL